MELFNPFSLNGKKILVTGASSGIGKAIAVSCAKMGAAVILVGRNEKRLQETLSIMPEGDHKYFIVDLTDSEAIVSMVSICPNLDGVVHCAGIWNMKIAKMIVPKDVDEVMDINFKAPVLLQAELLKQKKINRCASLVFISSIASESGKIGNGLYSASKGAITSYMKCLSLELAPKQIRVNAICPAMVWTDLIRNNCFDTELLKKDEQTYPLKRYGTPQDVANLAIYILSDASAWMTGSSVNITGGVQ